MERFNFFDVYAYLLPGIAFLGSIWLPFGILAAKWPPADLSSAVLTLTAAYIVGHVLYYPASATLPTESTGRYKDVPTWRVKPSHPSDYLLDAKELTFPEHFKVRLQELINSRFEGQVRVNVRFGWDRACTKMEEAEVESSQRDFAFLLCRSALMTEKVPSYGEQFHGLYEFLRCLTVVFAVVCAYHLGWALAVWYRTAGGGKAAVAATAAIAVTTAGAIAHALILRRKAKGVEKGRLGALLIIELLVLVLLACPFFLDLFLESPKAPQPFKACLLAGMALTDAFVSWRCWSGYRPFAKEFAKAIYRDFSVSANNHGKGEASCC